MEVLELYTERMNEENKELLEEIKETLNQKREVFKEKAIKIQLSSIYGSFGSDEFKTEFNSEEQQEVSGFYGKTYLPAKNRYVVDNIENRKLLTEKFGDGVLSNFPRQTYLEIDLKERTWSPSFDFNWLYTNQPPLTPIDEILSF